jgi:hypothetical protein
LDLLLPQLILLLLAVAHLDHNLLLVVVAVVGAEQADY